MALAKRSQKLNKTALQVKMILAFLLVATVSALFHVYLLNRFALLAARRLPTDGDQMLALVPDMLTTSLLVTLAVLVPGTFLVGLLVTHRVAGPVHALERYLERHLEGAEQGPCALRKGDELQELCSLMNQALGKQHAQLTDSSGREAGKSGESEASASAAA